MSNKALCFDLDGTLARYQGDFVGLVAGVGHGLESRYSAQQLLATFSVCEKRPGHITLPKILACLSRKLGIELSQSRRRAVTQSLLADYVRDMRLLPGAEAALAVAQSHGKVALISNGPSDMQRAALAALGIESFFDAVLVSGDKDIGIRKPEPRIFELASERLGVSCKDSLMIGDSYDADIVGAESVGMKS